MCSPRLDPFSVPLDEPFLGGDPPPLDLDYIALEEEEWEPQKDDETPCQFAPLMQLRRTQALEGTGAAAASSPRCNRSAEEHLCDAMEAMDALMEACLSVDELGKCLAGEESLPVVERSRSMSLQSSSLLCSSQPRPRRASAPVVCYKSEASTEAATSSASSIASSFTSTALSAAAATGDALFGALLGSTSAPVSTPVESSPSVEGLLRIEGKIAKALENPFRETLQVVLLRLLNPLAQLDKLLLTVPPEGPYSSSGGHSSLAFAYQIFVADPHDVEPLRETLLLEAESGGARSLFPLLAEQLCEDGLPTPKHLKVRLEVRGAC